MKEIDKYFEDIKYAKQLKYEMAKIDRDIYKEEVKIENLNDKKRLIEEEYKNIENSIKKFAKQHLTFSVKEVVAEFKKVCKVHGITEPLAIEIDLNAEIVHDKNIENHTEKMSLVDAIVYFNNEKNNKNTSYLYVRIFSTKNDFDFIQTIPLDFGMKLCNGSKLYKNLYTELYCEDNGNNELEYFTELKLKNSAKNNVPVTLDGLSYMYKNEIVKEVYDNLFEKSLGKTNNEEIKL